MPYLISTPNRYSRLDHKYFSTETITRSSLFISQRPTQTHCPNPHHAHPRTP